jgi:hypothetical protein
LPIKRANKTKGEIEMSEENEMMMNDGDWNSRVEKIQAFIKEHQKELKTDEDSRNA